MKLRRCGLLSSRPEGRPPDFIQAKILLEYDVGTKAITIATRLIHSSNSKAFVCLFVLPDRVQVAYSPGRNASSTSCKDIELVTRRHALSRRPCSDTTAVGCIRGRVGCNKGLSLSPLSGLRRNFDRIVTKFAAHNALKSVT